MTKEIEKEGHTVGMEPTGKLFIDSNEAVIYRIAKDQIIILASRNETFLSLSNDEFYELIGEVAADRLGGWAARAIYSLWIRAIEDTHLRRYADFSMPEQIACASPIHAELVGNRTIYTNKASITEDLRREGCFIIMPLCTVCETEQERRRIAENTKARNGGEDASK